MTPTKDTAVAERRRENRYYTGNCHADILLGGADTSVPGLVMDVSRSGMRVRSDCHLAAQRSVRVRVGNMNVTGWVRYCTSNSDGTFDTGVLINHIHQA
jgi:hypothetical protein